MSPNAFNNNHRHPPSIGIMIGHVTPEAQDGGPIAVINSGDTIKIDFDSKEISLVNRVSSLRCFFIPKSLVRSYLMGS